MRWARLGQARESVQRAWRRRGDERSALIQVIKGIIASLTSYLFAVYVLDSQVPSFGPFAALLVVQVTVYRSVLHALRYMVAVVVGLACAGLIGLTLGETVWTLAVLVTLTLIIGQWPRLREFGPQAAIVGIFTFAAGGGNDMDYLVSLLLTVVCGAVVGTVTNLAFVRPIRFADAAEAVDNVCSAIADMLDEIAGRLREDDPLTDADAWRERADRMTDTVQRARTEIDFEAENARLNPRRLRYRERPVFTDYRDAIDAVSRSAGELQGVTLALRFARQREDGDIKETFLGEFLPQYADLLDSAAEAVHLFGQYHRLLEETDGDLRGALEAAFDRLDDLSGMLRDSHPSDARTIADCGTLLIEVDRLLSHLLRSGSRQIPDLSDLDGEAEAEAATGDADGRRRG
ncbi:FUSC family protein [Phytoactinopolyspora halotolerans]|uniref:FUSC family protein n=1 Tax=Phytoactinopolyspora halotolerans TaxID=1981512 RepID=A0A6L9S8Q7_9ACTN|nr:aromatic acid exporter family protein [Phytoactinopolyspora halotolerans]NEE00984.1 hypothetical protein [Phytoactinopolyspora halotolerans]